MRSSPSSNVGWDDSYDIGYGTSGAQYPNAAERARLQAAGASVAPRPRDQEAARGVELIAKDKARFGIGSE
jgi:hypothetical protein